LKFFKLNALPHEKLIKEIIDSEVTLPIVLGETLEFSYEKEHKGWFYGHQLSIFFV
jgi:hypothetical protein